MIWLTAGIVVLSGCQKEKAKEPEAKPPEVFIEQPYEHLVTEKEEFTGMTMAVETIEIRARVSGYLDKNFFKDGDLVREGALLFQIDDRPYQADFDRTSATLAQAKAHLERLKRQEERAIQLQEKKAISQEAFDQTVFDRAEAEAALAAAVASRDMAELNLGFTKITSKITGRIGRRLVDPGNLVQADITPLTTVVSIDPIYAYFDVDERTLLRLRRTMEAEHTESALSSHVPVEVTLADEDSAPVWGKINFLDNQVDANTGTLRARAVIDNPKGMLSPGLFVRLRVPIGTPQKRLLVHEEALQNDQGQRFLWILNDEDVALSRQVKIGWLTDGKRVILDGLKPSDRVIVKGVQRVRRNKKVSPQPLDPVSNVASAVTKSKQPDASASSDGGR
ncbi:MAG TPA: efflux RND transporter periplasmic adaptor subunit [Planctomycetaceae bacterium]|nr:efflux RND transporter periplasmic adaptor subunit [Planctomycetaceae bacterium]